MEGPLRLVGAHTDVTEQVAAEQALRQSEERYRKLADQLAELNATLAQRVEEKTRERDRIWNVSQDLLVVSDRDGVWRTVNPAWTQTLGWSEAELLNRTSEWLEHPDDNGVTRAHVRELGARETTVKFENRFRHKDGSYRWLSWVGVSDRDSNYAVARDVTAEKAAAERLKATEEALLQSQKMEAVGQLTGGIAHDFNNLLTGIVGSLDLLQTRLNQGRTDNVARYIQAAMTSANRAAALTHRLLAFARRQPLVPKVVDVNQLVVSLEDLLRRTIGETIDLEIVALDGLWCTLCDPNQLESALLNLAINARDAMPDGGKLVIATSNARLDNVDRRYIGACARRLHLHRRHRHRNRHERGSGGARLRSVLYHQADRPGHRTWAFDDLWICPAVERPCDHRQQAGPGNVGQTLSAATPWRASRRACPGRQCRPNTPPPARRCWWSRTSRWSAVSSWRCWAIRAIGRIEAADGPSGLRLLRMNAQIDLLITDVGLPGMNGRQLADQARETRPGLKILFITGYAESVAIADGFLQPGMEMITKPFDLDHLSRRDSRDDFGVVQVPLQWLHPRNAVTRLFRERSASSATLRVRRASRTMKLSSAVIDRHTVPVRNGLVIRSWPMVERAPWPQKNPTSSPSGNSFSVIDLISVA